MSGPRVRAPILRFVPCYVPPVKRLQIWRQAIQRLHRRDEVRLAQMRIPERHADALVPEHFLNLSQGASLHRQMARAGMSEVMKPKI